MAANGYLFGWDATELLLPQEYTIFVRAAVTDKNFLVVTPWSSSSDLAGCDLLEINLVSKPLQKR
jgi:hypothetical protein